VSEREVRERVSERDLLHLSIIRIMIGGEAPSE
jgi:hypothetical protein